MHKSSVISSDFIKLVCSRLEQNKRVRRTLPDRGRLHIDRQLPFLCIYRRPTQRDDPGTERLLLGEASYLLASGERPSRKRLALLVRRIAATLGRKFGAFLIVEIWSAHPPDIATKHEAPGPTPAFRIVVPKTGGLPSTLERLEQSLKRIRIQKRAATVEVLRGVRIAPPAMKPLLSSSQAKELGAKVIGIELEPIYRDTRTGQTHPAILRNIHTGLSRALKQGIFEFTRTQTVYRPPHYQALGRRAVVKAVWEVDSRLADISDSFDFLLSVTPVNLPSAWAAFRKSRFERAPELIYRPRVIDPALMKRRLYDIPIERIEDPTIAHLFQEKQDELDRKITMISDCGTPKFIHGSLQVFGGVHAAIARQARALLEHLPPRTRDDSKGGHITPETFARYAKKELGRYRRQHSGFTASVVLRDDIPGLLVSRGRLLVGRTARIPATRAEALIHHEVGTHLVTYYNGHAQPFKQLYVGLAGYDELQEGLAVLSEFLVGGLSRPRMRTLAARVVAVQHLIDGASFVDTFRVLNRGYGFEQRSAFMIVMRVYRGGGLTKDAAYLKGLKQLLAYLGKGGDIEPLFVGKINTSHVTLVKELQWRQVLVPPPWRPRCLRRPDAVTKLKALRKGLSPFDLVEKRTRTT